MRNPTESVRGHSPYYYKNEKMIDLVFFFGEISSNFDLYDFDLYKGFSWENDPSRQILKKKKSELPDFYDEFQ
jgi:hypothetical protein